MACSFQRAIGNSGDVSHWLNLKKAKKAIATPQQDIELIKSRLRDAEEHYQARAGRLIGYLALTGFDSGLLVVSFGVPVDQSTKSRHSWALSLLARCC